MKAFGIFHTFFMLYTFGLGNPTSDWSSNIGENVSESLHLFARELVQSVGRTERNSNLVISPLSLFAALSLTSIGAKGSTLSQIQQVLRLPPDALTHKGGVAHIMASMTTEKNKDVVMDMANFLWVPRGLALKAEYARSVQDIFQTQVRDADFSRVEEVREVINKRIETMTRGLIKEIFPRGSIAKHTRMLLANALYFKGLWLHPFNQSSTFAEPFFTVDGRSTLLPMMHGFGTFQAGILDNLGAKAILLPYQGNRYGLLCVVPDRNKELSELESRLLGSGYTPTILLRRMIQRDVNITLPKFNIKFDAEMSQIFRKMGIRNLFTNEADLSGMSSSSYSAALKVSNIYHQSTIEVNEGGSEASVATGFEITPLIGGVGKHFGPIEFKADRPFLFYLIDRENNNIPLIMGRVYNPQSQNINQLNHQVIGKLEPNRLPFKSGISSFPKAHPSFVKQEFQSTSINPSSFVPDDDQVIYPQAPSLSNYYKAIQQVTNRYFPNSHSLKNFHNPITFPDEEFNERRLKRESGNATSSSITSTPNDDKDLGIRLKDPLWFNKPTASEVIIPINVQPNPEKHHPQEHSIKPFKPSETAVPETMVSFAPLPSQTIPEGLKTQFSSTTPPSIFHSLSSSQYNSPVFHGTNNNNVWNPNIEENVGGQAPGFPPIPPIGPNGRPVLIPPPWYQNQPNPYFQSLPPAVPYNQFSPPVSGSGIFFPDYRFSSRN